MTENAENSKKGSALLIPFKIDTLLVNPHEGPFVEAKVDFSSLPYKNMKEDVNSEFTFIGENFLSELAQTNNLFLIQASMYAEHYHLPYIKPNSYS